MINVVGAIGGLYLVTPFLMDKLGILFSFVGGALVAVGASFAIFVAGGVTECADTASAACNWAVPLAAGGSAKVVAKYVPDHLGPRRRREGERRRERRRALGRFLQLQQLHRHRRRVALRVHGALHSGARRKGRELPKLPRC